MRITGGKLRGRVLATKVRDGVRPTSSRVREALFSMIGQHLEGVTMLDAFGGSGLITFEAISRGASVTTVERNRAVGHQIQAEAERLEVHVDLRIGDARALVTSGVWDIVFMDPPYADDPIPWGLLGCRAATAVLIIEHRAGAKLPADLGAFSLDRSRQHGDSVLAVYRPRDLACGEE